MFLINPLVALVAPFVGFVISGLFGRFFGRRGSILINTCCLIFACMISWFTFFKGMLGNKIAISVFAWFSFLVGNTWSFTMDSITLVMFCVVLTVSSLVHLYSIKYMEQDPHIIRFFTYLSLFTTFMLFLVSGNNLLILFLGWEGVGLSSYLLINFWYTRLQANKAALKAMVVNRVGDISFIGATGLAIFLIGDLKFSTAIVVSNFFIVDFSWSLTLLAVFVLLAAVGKSAQIGLHTWLPDAMEGPTPVSALIHAATMVTAGVFLLIRVSTIFSQSSVALSMAIVFGALTAIFAGTVGITQFDIKRVIAYSTCSQLGYTVLICGGAIFSLGLFHLFNHAFFKACLFLGAGSIIHAASDEQDMRRFGLISIISPLLCTIFFVASLALMGIPFLAGFYSKEGILEGMIVNNTVLGLWGYWIGLAAAGFTTIYSFKVAYWTFFSKTTFGYKTFVQDWHKISKLEIFILSVLSILGVSSGYIFKDCFIGFGGNYFNNIVSASTNLVNGEFLPLYIKLFPLVGIVGFLIISYVISQKSTLTLIWGQTIKGYVEIFSFLSHKWYFNILQNVLISQPILNLGYRSFWVWDRWILEQARLTDC